jgi:hypothetical protein
VTHDEINRKVAELRGWTKCGCEHGCPFWYDPDGELHLDVPDEIAQTGEALVLAYIASQEAK